MGPGLNLKPPFLQEFAMSLSTFVRRAAGLAAVSAGLLLGGCAGLKTVNVEVSSFGSWPLGRAAGSYAFERLPSQQAQGERQAAVEALAATALSQAGFVPAAAGAPADVTVQLGARVTRQDRSPWDDPLWGPAWGPRWVMTPWSRPGWGWTWGPGNPEYLREVAVLVRDRASGEALYEARASNGGLTEGGSAMLGALFSAALQAFPAVQGEPHTVRASLP
jgi:hypothetical protein